MIIDTVRFILSTIYLMTDKDVVFYLLCSPTPSTLSNSKFTSQNSCIGKASYSKGFSNLHARQLNNSYRLGKEPSTQPTLKHPLPVLGLFICPSELQLHLQNYFLPFQFLHPVQTE